MLERIQNMGTAVVFFALMLSGCIWILYKYWKTGRRIGPELIKPFTTIIEGGHIRYNPYLRFFAPILFLNGNYHGRKITLEYNYDRGFEVITITSAVKLHPDRKLPWYKIPLTYPEILPGYRIMQSNVVFKKSNGIPAKVSLTFGPNEPQQILDGLIDACNKAEQGI